MTIVRRGLIYFLRSLNAVADRRLAQRYFSRSRIRVRANLLSTLVSNPDQFAIAVTGVRLSEKSRVPA